MTKKTAFVSVISAICAMTLFSGSAGAQTPDETPADHGTKVAAPQPRAPQKAEKSHHKIQERGRSAAGTSRAKSAAAERTPTSPPPQAPAEAAPPTETQNFRGWAVTCLPQPADHSARTCVAKMAVLKSNEDRRPILIMSVVKTGGTATFVLQTPTGITLKSGATVQIGQAPPRHLTYESCEPALCTATAQMDDPFVQEIASASTATATWVGIGIGDVRVEYALQEARNTLAYLVSK